MIVRSFYTIFLYYLFNSCFAANSISAINQSVTDFLNEYFQTIGNNKHQRIEISVIPVDSRLQLEQCKTPLQHHWNNKQTSSGRITIKVQCNGQWSIYVAAMVNIYENILVASHPIARGVILTESDVDYQEKDISTLHGHFTSSINSIIGKQLRRSIKEGQAITARALIEPVLVKKGDIVTITAQTRHLSINMQGIALQNGTRGMPIRVRNMDSQRIIRAQVIEPGQVQVNL